MKKILYVIIALIIIGSITVYAIGPLNVMLNIVKPRQSFAEDKRVPAPDYSKVEFWAALPQTDDLADLRPEGVPRDTVLKDIDVFFIHPTGYLKGDHWNSPMEFKSGTEENTNWMMANQASTFNDCAVYAPRYREASIFSFFNIDDSDEKSALNLAYQDVEKAFDYYISNYNKGKPFIIASHSQGSYHALPLIKNKIDASPLSDQLVAAYIIGMSTITEEAVSELKNVRVCDSPDQTNCIIHWATFAIGAPRPEGWGKTMICVNPISWKRDENRIEKSLHQGYVPSTGAYNLSFYGKDKFENVSFGKLGPPQQGHTFAQCFEGRLIVDEQDTPSLAMGEGNYHGLDYQLFHMDIRKNVSTRVRKYLSNKGVSL